MSTITKEQLIEKLQHRIAVAAKYPDLEEAQLDAAIFKIALASLEAEPVMYAMTTNGVFDAEVVSTSRAVVAAWVDEWNQDESGETPYKIVPLHAAPPAPVSVPDEVISAIENLKRTLVNCNRYNYCSDAVKRLEGACRGAMLQGKAEQAPQQEVK